MTKTEQYRSKLDDAQKQYPLGAKFQHYKGGIYSICGYVINRLDKHIYVRMERVDGPDFDIRAEEGIEFVCDIADLSNTFIDEADNIVNKYVRVRYRQYFKWEPL